MINFFKGIIKFFTVNAAIITAVATLGLFYATFNLTKETTKLARASNFSFITGYVQSSPVDIYHMNFIVDNTGNAPAFDVAVTVKPALPDSDGKFPDGRLQSNFSLNILPPNTKNQLRGLLVKHLSNTTYVLEISWSEYPGQKERQSLSYNISVEDGFRFGWNEKGLHQVVKQLEKINDTLKYNNSKVNN